MKRSTRSLACLVALLLVGSATLLAQEATPSEEAALQAYRQGAFSRAVDLYTRALSETDDPAHRARLQVQIAWTLFALGREGEVNTHLRAALVEDPNLTLVPDYYTQEFLGLFEAARRQGLPLTDQPNTPPPDLEATIASISQRIESGSDLEGALADVDRLLSSYPQDPRLIPQKIQILQKLGRDEEIQRLMDGAGLGGPTPYDRLSIPDLILRANQLLDDGDVGTALELLRQAVARQPSNVAALELMAEAARRAARWQEAEYALKTALGLQPDNIGLKLRLGEIYQAKGDMSAARDIFRQLTEQFPHSDRAWAALGLIDARLGMIDRALNEVSQALHENPLLPEVQLAYGELLLAGGQVDQALEAFRTAANMLRDDPQVTARLGQALLFKGNHEEALGLLRTAVQGRFAPPGVQRSLALALVLNDNFSEAERVLSDLGGTAPEETAIIRCLLQLRHGDPAAAEQTIRPLARTRGNDPRVLNLLATSLYRQARYEEALTLLEGAYNLDRASEIIAANLHTTAAARDAEILAQNARDVKAAPTR